MNTKLGINLKKLLSLAHISVTELSRRTGVKQPIIHKLVTGENTNPKIATLQPITDYFEITINQLIEEEDIEILWHGLTKPDHKGWREIPLAQWCHDLKKPIFNEVALVNYEVHAAMFALLIEDTSMEPIFSKNCLILIDTTHIAAEFDYILIRLKEKFKLRQYISINNTKYIVPLNRTSGKMSKLSSAKQIIGVVKRIIYDPIIKEKS